MKRRYLVGPVTAAYAENRLQRHRRAGECLAFNAAGSTDVTIEPLDSWQDLCRKFPPGWQPDFIVLSMAYTSIPACLWTAPVPVIGMAEDWPLLWHYYRSRLPRCELVLTDRSGTAVLSQAKVSRVQTVNLVGCENGLIDLPAPVGERDLDILFLGNLNPAIKRDRVPWLQRLARMGERWRVSIQTGIFGDAHRRLLTRARIVVHRSTRERWGPRAIEAAAAGALPFIDETIRDIPPEFQDRRNCVLFNDENLESLAHYYLGHEEVRAAAAEAARSLVPRHTFGSLWDSVIESIEAHRPAMLEHVRQRSKQPSPSDELLTRTWQALSCPPRSDPTLAHELEAQLSVQPQASSLRVALGLALSRSTQDTASKVVADICANQFRQALASEPGHVMAAVNLAEALAAAGHAKEAIEQARKALAMLERARDIDIADLNFGLFRTEYSVHRVEWEEAAYRNVDDPELEIRAKVDLLRWRLHGLLAQLTEEITSAYDCVLARPDIAQSRSILGCLLATKSRPLEALPHLRKGSTASPRPAMNACDTPLHAGSCGWMPTTALMSRTGNSFAICSAGSAMSPMRTP